MDNFNLRKFLAEGKLFEETNPIWVINKFEDSADIEQAGPAYKNAVIDAIKSKHSNISSKDLEKSIEVTNNFWYDEARSNAKGSDPEDIKVSAEEFADSAIEYYEDALMPSSGDGYADDSEAFSHFPSIEKSFDHNLKWYIDNDPYLTRHMSPDVKADFLNYAEKTLKPSNPSPDEIEDAIRDYYYEYDDLAEGLAEEKLHEAMSPQDVVDIADTVAEEFTKESAEEGDFLIYTVGRMEDESFELDTDISAQTPKDLDTRGVGEGWGGIFRIKPSSDGYEVRNAEKGGLVAMIDAMGNFRMLSAAESRDELDMDRYNDELDMKDGEKTDYMERRREMSDYIEEGEDEDIEAEYEQALADYKAGRISQEEFAKFSLKKGQLVDKKRKEMGLDEEQENKPSNKMKKSELKEMIKMAMLEDARTDAEQEGYKDGFEDAKDDIEDKLKDMKVSEAEDVDVEKDVDVDVEDDENVDVDIEKDVKVDDEETEADIDVKASVSGESEEVEAVQGLLTKALEMSQALGDEKLEDQIGNTITYFTRAHVSRVNEMDVDSVSTNIDDVAAAEIGLDEAKDEEVKENLNESVVFPMWNKIK